MRAAFAARLLSGCMVTAALVLCSVPHAQQNMMAASTPRGALLLTSRHVDSLA